MEHTSRVSRRFLGDVHYCSASIPSGSVSKCRRYEYVFPSIFFVIVDTDCTYTDYAVVIIMGVFIYAGLHWLISARRWFKGPVRTVEMNTIDDRSVSDADVSLERKGS